MSAPTASPPRATAGATTLVAVLAVAALTVHEPLAGLGAAVGGVFATAIVTASNGDRYVLPAAMFSGSVLAGLALLGTASTARLGVLLLSLPAAVVGVGTATIHLDASVDSTKTLERIALQGLLVTLCLSALVIVTLGAGDTLGGVPVSDGGRLLAMSVTAGVVTTVGVATMPPALFPFTDNRNRARVKKIQRQATILSLAGTVLVAVLFGVADLFGSLPTLFVESSLPRLALLTYIAAGLTVLAVAWYARWTWYDTSTELDAAVLLASGTVIGILVVVAAIVGLSDGSSTALLQLLLLAFPVFGAGWLLLNRSRKILQSGTPPAPSTVTAFGLCTSGVVVAATIPSNGPRATGIAGLAAVGALTAGLFVYKAGLVGRRFGIEVGRAGVSRRTQLVRIGWVGGLTGVGFVVTVTLIWLTTVFAPALSVPATASTLAGCVALFAGVWLLLE